jgi:DNA-binding CsgD family transcriptional regulator
MEGSSNHMEIAQELGISLGEVKALKKKINRT